MTENALGKIQDRKPYISLFSPMKSWNHGRFLIRIFSISMCDGVKIYLYWITGYRMNRNFLKSMFTET